MYFNIDYATENFIDGWLAPDNPATTPRFKVETDNSGITYIVANVLRQDIIDAKLHDTGLVGFRIDDQNVPRFSSAREVIISETVGNKQIYRRSAFGPFVPSKLIIINNLAVPSKYVRRSIGSQFVLSYPSLDEEGVETAINLLRNPSVKSIYAEGRFMVAKHYQFLRDFDYHMSALIEEPFTELANRIAIVKKVLELDNAETILRSLSPFYSSLRECAESLSRHSVSELNTALARLSTHQKAVVCDPLTRMLACGDNEEPEPRHVAVALSTLSNFDSVGIVSNIECYKDAILPQIPNLNLSELAIQHLSSANEFTELLQQSPVAKKLLRNDNKIYAWIEQCISQGTETKGRSA